MTFFIRGSPPTKAIGWKPVITVTVSDRGSQRIGDLTKTDTGFGPTAAGTGTQTSVLPGQPTTTADGSILAGPDGAGSPEINGLRPGSPGGKVTKTLAGLLFRPKQTSRGIAISSWSDSYYGIGPAAYAFISYSHWHEPSYAQYIEPPQRNVQIISQTRNVTNIVTNNNVINNFGPPVQTVAAKTNQNIQQVKLALSPATDPKANYGQTLQGNQLKVVAPRCHPQLARRHTYRLFKTVLQILRSKKDGKAFKPQEAEKLRKTIAEQNPPAERSAETDAFCESADWQQGTDYRTLAQPALSCGCRAENADQFIEARCAFAEREYHSGCFAECSGRRKEVRST